MKLKDAKDVEPEYLKLVDNDKILTDNKTYRKDVSTLLYLTTVTRLNISAAINILSLRNENSREKDWNAIKKVIFEKN